ncbi:bifunctional glutamate/proline--tRNA ligase [Bradysia coprophila]|uniref:bifunctional glutamate/proline--tRNA ligase n=1 Tax=Bradysia coprophila TaxID=38358 RepID=UPI00187D80C3|nr:bifunctional glutamate/proline--tRNA ligase [Bradysia coprophila]
MSIKLTSNLKRPPIGGLIVAELIKDTVPTENTWSTETSIVFRNNTKLVCNTTNDILRALAREALKYELYGKSPAERTQVDHWLTFSLTFQSNVQSKLDYLQKCLAPLTYLVANKLTIADLSVFNEIFLVLQEAKTSLPNHVQRWYDLIRSQPFVESVIKNLPADARQVTKPPAKVEKSGERKQEGKFVDLPGAEMGKVIVRFPPEASGYLHIGHAKAALLNQYYQQAFNGKLIMRFDDTNPAKENVEFEKVILEDLEMLEIKPDLFTHTSQYFDLMLEYCEKLMKDGKAYADDTEPELMKKEREQRTESVNRSNSVEKNFQMWGEMLKGTATGQKCCIRAKIDMSSPNGCLRDPTIYRCKNEPHPRTGTQYKVYPTYDFACPIVDAIENVTHTLRTMEYHDRDDQFYWFIEALQLRRPYIWEYSRLNMTNTVLSKRKLTWFVEEGLVDGWDDPRFPTVRGILRRGMTVQGLKEFIIAQGSSKSVVFMEWDKIWAFNKKVIDPVVPRYTAVDKNNVVVNVAGAVQEKSDVPAHPKNVDVGMKTVWFGPRILIDYVDAESLKEGELATFINWGNLLINKINRKDGKIVSIDASLKLDNKDFKKTVKLTWLCETTDEFTPTYCVFFEHIISKAVLGRDEDFKNYIGHQTRTEVEMIGDPELRKCKKGDIIQLQRRGYFKVDRAYAPPSIYTGVTSPIILLEVPDGKEKPSTQAPAANKETAPAKQTAKPAANNTSDINEKIKQQGDIVRDLKTKKAVKADIDSAVKVLLALKAEYKNLSGKDWKPDSEPATSAAAQPATTVNVGTGDANAINAKIVAQGEKIRDLKAKKADKATIDPEVKALLSLKADYKTATGQDWKPGCVVPTAAEPVAPASSNNSSELNEKIKKQGDLVRDLKAKKAPKPEIDTAVKTLLSLKADYKTLTGADWKPESTTQTAPPPAAQTSQSNSIHDRIVAQGDKVRDLKSKKAAKAAIDAEVKALLALKAEFKASTGKDWTPTVASTVEAPPPVTQTSQSTSIHDQIVAQGDKVRDLKSKKAAKAAVDAEVKALLALKAEFKASTGKDWTPSAAPTVAAPKAMESAPSPPSGEKEVLTEKITAQGDLVRTLKSSGAAKDKVDEAVKLLLELKGQYKTLTGTDFPVAGRGNTKSNADNKPKAAAPKEKKEAPKPKAAPKAAGDAKDDGTGLKKQTRLGLEAKKDENLPDWYSQILTKGEMIEYYDISGCYILRPWSMAIWSVIKNWFTEEITKIGVKEVYFPMFVSKSALEKEKSHIADFSPEVAWVTKSGDSDLAEPIAIRPTSETIMYPAYAKWIQSYRDLPLKLNQWSNVVRWEFKHPQPFLRTREFLWQEGHTAFASKKDAEEEVLVILDLYARIYEELLAIPVRKGRKTEKEKFAGGDYTTTVEAFISASGRSIQGATSHHLGKNFSKMFDIVYEDPTTQEKEFVYQNSWGLTTRTIGVMIMVHGDDKGLVLPPKVASVQAIIVPCGITVNSTDADRAALQKSCNELEVTLKLAGVRVEGDYRDNYSPGWKFNHWELKGVPIRIELGPKDMKSNQVVLVRRDTNEKSTVQRADISKSVAQVLDEIQVNLFRKAKEDFDSHSVVTKDWKDFCLNLDKKNVLLAPFCGEIDCETTIKDQSAVAEGEAEIGQLTMGAKSLCIPFDQPAAILPTDKCINPACTKKPLNYCLFGRSY